MKRQYTQAEHDALEYAIAWLRALPILPTAESSYRDERDSTERAFVKGNADAAPTSDHEAWMGRMR